MDPRSSLETTSSTSTSASASSGGSFFGLVKTVSRTLGVKATEIFRKTTGNLKEQDFTTWEDSLKGLINSFHLGRRDVSSDDSHDEDTTSNVRRWEKYKATSPTPHLPRVARRTRSFGERFNSIGRLSMKRRTRVDVDDFFESEDGVDVNWTPLPPNPPRLDIPTIGSNEDLERSRAFRSRMNEAMKDLIGVDLPEPEAAVDVISKENLPPKDIQHPKMVRPGVWEETGGSTASSGRPNCTTILIPGGIVRTRSQKPTWLIFRELKLALIFIWTLRELTHNLCFYHPQRELYVLQPYWSR